MNIKNPMFQNTWSANLVGIGILSAVNCDLKVIPSMNLFET
jgi:hypothetical protein